MIRFSLALLSAYATRSPYESSQNQALLHLTRYRGWGRGRGGNRSKHILFSSTRLCQESMHLKFFFSAIYNITIVSDLVGSTYLITGYKLESEVRPDNWQWGRRRYFRKERGREYGRGRREGGRERERQRKRGHARIIFKINRFTRIITLTDTVTITVRAKRPCAQ